MKVRINKEKGIISFNNMEVKLQAIYYKKYDDKEKLNRDIKRQLRLTQKKDKEQAKKHYTNALQLLYANILKDIDDDTLSMILWLEDTYIPKMTSYDDTKIDYETKILARQERQGFYDI